MRKAFKVLVIVLAWILVTGLAFAASSVKDEGTYLGEVTHLDFVGDRIAATKSGGTATITQTPDYTNEVVTASSDTVVTADNRTRFLLTNTATTSTVTLPACADGLEFEFVQAAVRTAGAWVQYVEIDPASTADSIVWLALDGGDKLKSAGATGNSVMLIGSDSNKWYVGAISGAWTDGGA